MAASRILQREVQELQDHPVCGIHVTAQADNLLRWQLRMQGPHGSLYEGGVFHLKLEISSQYPFIGPGKVSFITKIFHPILLRRTGNAAEVCSHCLMLKIGGLHWMPKYRIKHVLRAIYELLCDPYCCEPHPGVAGYMHKADPALFASTAKEWTRKYAVDDKFAGG
eukprot:scpid86133/ scgid21414/ Ubiquitin conjugating enzyme E2 B; UBC1